MTDPTAQSTNVPASGGVSRRSLFRAAGVGAAVVGGGALLDACSSTLQGASSSSSSPSSSGSSSSSSSSSSGNNEITIGWIHPLTGPLAGFGHPDNWVISQIMGTSQYK